MYLITGATGFVGKKLLDDLTRRRLAFRAISRTDRPGHTTVKTLDADTDWSEALQDVDIVVHLAARVHVMNEQAADPMAAFRSVNVGGTMALARQAAVLGVKTFVFVSSIKVNGEEPPQGKKFSADDMPNPTDPYGISKMEAEKALLELAADTGMKIVILRPPLIYGPGVKANFASMVRWVKRGIPLPLALATNRRSLVFVGNMTDLIIHAAQHPAAANQIFLAGDGKDLSVADLLKAIAKASGKPSRLLPIPPGLMRLALKLLGKEAIARRLLAPLEVDIDKTMKVLNWTPPFSIEEGLSETVASDT